MILLLLLLSSKYCYVEFCSETNMCCSIFSAIFSEKKQRPIIKKIHFGQTVNWIDNTQKLKSIDYLTDFNDITDKVTNLQRVLKDGTIDKDLLK